MFDIKETKKAEDSSESLDTNRIELLWETREEELIQKWVKQALDHAKQHNIAGEKCKLLYTVFSLLCIVSPMILSAIDDYLEPIVRTCCLVTVGIISGISSFFNFGRKMSDHFEYQDRFEEYSNRIAVEMHKPKASRPPCDVYLNDCQNIYSRLCAGAPS